MGGRIPENIVERIKGDTDIVSVISEFVSLKRSGKDYKGLCPFHQEKTPSFFVIPSRGFFHCFGCGKGGSAINFIMEHERMDYPSALKYLAEKAGIEIPRLEQSNGKDERLFAALSAAASYFEHSLKETSSGQLAREYLRSRGIESDTSRTFGIGFAPPGWDGLIKSTAAKGIRSDDLEAAGLIIKKEGYYDRFRNRLIIPVRNLSGKVIGFGGRTLPGDDSPKYINSPETTVYKKGKILFGMDVSRNEIRSKNEAVVVEGYFDLIALYQAGIKNVVASSGTGFTPEQASLLRRFCDRVVLLFDSDSAGVKASFRACGVLYNAGLDPELVLLPKGNDPDSYVRQQGPSGMSKLISESMDIIDFVRQSLKGRFADQSLSRQKKIVGVLAELMAPIDDGLTKDLLARKMFDKLDIDTRTLGIIGEAGNPRQEQSDTAIPTGMSKTEMDFIALLFAHPVLLKETAAVVDESLFSESEHARIYSALCEFDAEGRDLSVGDLTEVLSGGGAGQRLREIAIQSEKMVDLIDEFPKYLNRFRTISNKKRLAELKGLIEEAGRKSDVDRLESLTREFQNLNNEVKANDTRV